jgi:hypothetical protein
MRVVNNLTKPGDIRRVDLTADTVRVVLADGTERLYANNEPRYRDQADPGYQDAMADMRRDSQ